MHRPHRTIGLLAFFFLIGVGAIHHGFPMINHYGDEMYFAYGPFWAMSQWSLLPHAVPYGTLTYYASFFLQAPLALILLAVSGWDTATMLSLLMEQWYLMYIMPRVLHLFSFLGIVWLTCRAFRLDQENEHPYAFWLVLITCSNLVLLTFMHSGKMWIDSILFLLICLLTFGKKPLWSMGAAAAAVANFPLMVFLWLQTLAGSLLLRHKLKVRIGALMVLALLIPIITTLLNIENITAQLQSAFREYLFSEHGGQAAPVTQPFVLLYIRTVLAYLWKLLLTQPMALMLLVLAFVSGARVIDRMRFRFVLVAIVFYFLLMGMMFYSRPWAENLRYMLPFPIFGIVLLSSLELPRSRLMIIAVRIMGGIAVWTAVISTISLALPTTYMQAYTHIRSEYNNPNVVIASSVSQISLPYSKYAASLLQTYIPARCFFRCTYALDNDPTFSFHGHFIDTFDTHTQGLTEQIRQDGKRLITVRPDPTHMNFVDVEHGLGSYFIRQAWWPETLGRTIVMEEVQ